MVRDIHAVSATRPIVWTARIAPIVLLACAPRLLPAAVPAPSQEERSEAPREDTLRDLPRGEPMYGTDAVALAAVGGMSARVFEHELLKALRERGQVPTGDPRLVELARWAAEMGRHALASAEIEEAARRLGYVGPTPMVLLMGGRYTTPTAIRGPIREAIESAPSNLPMTRYAVAERTMGDDSMFAVVVGSLEVALQPVRRRLAHSETMHLAGSLAERFVRTRLAITMPDGQVRELARDSREFAVDLRLAMPGTYKVELLGDGPSGPVVVANFPVYVDIDEPSKPARRDDRSDPTTFTPATLEERLLVLLNEARAAAHVGPLTSDDELAAVARAHSEDMATHGYFAHVSSTEGTPADRVRRAHVVGVSVVGENIVMANGPDEANRLLLDSPGHRENMLRAEFTHVGIGAVRAPLDSGSKVFTVTYVFAQRLK